MSRAYKVRVRESLTRDLRAEDRIESCIELLEILPPERMADLLRSELKQRGFEDRPDGTMVRSKGNGTTTTVDPCTGRVTVEATAGENVVIEGEREGFAYDDYGPGHKSTREKLQREVRADLERRADDQAGRLQSRATELLENELKELKREMAEVVHRVTAEALKAKARSLGDIKEITEDPEAGSLTIKLEV
jgi:hypothetical protein